MRYGHLPTLALLVFGVLTLPASRSMAEELSTTIRSSAKLQSSDVKAPVEDAANGAHARTRGVVRVIDCIRYGDELRGVLLDRNGKAATSIDLQLQDVRGKRRYAKSDAAGRFAFQGVGTGVYALLGKKHPNKVAQLQNGNTQLQWVRVWDSPIAPPTANSRLLAVVDGSVIRGQCCASAGISPGCEQCGDCMDCCGCGSGSRFGVGRLVQAALDNPWMVAAGTAAAIAIPIAANDDDVRTGDDVDAAAPSGEPGEDAS